MRVKTLRPSTFQERAPAGTGWLREFLSSRVYNSAVLAGVIPVGTRIGSWISRLIALPQLRRLAAGDIPWAPPRRPLSESAVTLISSGGVHLHRDRPFNINGDSTFRVIPEDARPADLAITHQAYDRTDALRDINLVFPIERLRELEAEKVIGRLAGDHYGFGLNGSARQLIPAFKEVARRVSESGVDLVLLVPA